jgi:hypothetical protein
MHIKKKVHQLIVLSSWSPDGAHVAAANAVNGIQCIAAVINRDDWNADVSLVGHQLPVEVTVSYNSRRG